MELLNSVPLPILVIILVLFVVTLIVMGVSYLKQKNLDSIRQDVYELFLKAEHIYRESSAGQQKLKWVVSQARSLLPGWLQTILSEETLMKIIDVWFKEIKDLLDDGKVNGSQKTTIE